MVDRDLVADGLAFVAALAERGRDAPGAWGTGAQVAARALGLASDLVRSLGADGALTAIRRIESSAPGLRGMRGRWRQRMAERFGGAVQDPYADLGDEGDG